MEVRGYLATFGVAATVDITLRMDYPTTPTTEQKSITKRHHLNYVNQERVQIE